MKETLDAIYERGIFMPLKRPTIPEGQRVRIEVETPTETGSNDLLELAAQVYQGLSEDEIDEIEHIAFNRRDFFRDRSA